MSVGGINNLSSYYLQQVLTSALQGAGVTANTSGSALPPQSDSARLSPFAQLASVLQQLQQSDPAKYKQVTAQIATNLQGAAQTAQSQGNSSAANQLNQLATDFTAASQTGQLPNLQDLAQSVGGGGGGESGGHHRHHHGHGGSGDSSATSSGSSSSTSQPPQNAAVNPETINPETIILQTLSNAGINVSHT